MKTSYIAAALLSTLLALPALAQIKVLELAHEAPGVHVTLPTSETGELTLKQCNACATVRLRATATTEYFLDKQPVSLAELRRYAERTPPRMYVVMQTIHTTQLARVQATSATPAAAD